MEKNRAEVESWLAHCVDYERQHRAKGREASAEYYRGGKEAYRRILDAWEVSEPSHSEVRRKLVLEALASGKHTIPAFARWETNGISYECDGVWYYMGWWSIIDYVTSRRIDEPLTRLEIALSRVEAAVEKKKP